MSGHSKWSKVKHQKATTDVVKARAFTKASHAITVAVHEGGGIADPAGNFKLRLAIEKAHDVNMPKENIDRAIAKGKGEGAEAIESLLYEAYGPLGVALLIEATTENRQRTVSMVKNALEKNGGVLASPGSVSYQFVRSGVIVVETPPDVSRDNLLEVSLDKGANDILQYEDNAEIYVEPKDVERISKDLTANGFIVDNAEIVYRPLQPTTPSASVEAQIERLNDVLSQLDDVQQVYTNISS